MSPSIRLIQKYGEWFQCSMRIEEPMLHSRAPNWSARDPVIRLGFAGSIDRAGDINDLLDPVIRRLVSYFGDQISIEFLGAKPKLAETLSLPCFPYKDDYAAYAEQMYRMHWDIGLAPMPETPFHACKYYNKLIEYSAFGILGVYSNVLPYREAVVQGRNGFLCDNTPEQWFRQIKELVENPEKLDALRRAVYENACQQFSLEEVAKPFRQLILSSCPQSAVSIPAVKVFFIKTADFYLRAAKFVRRHRLGIFRAAWRKIVARSQ